MIPIQKGLHAKGVFYLDTFSSCYSFIGLPMQPFSCEKHYTDVHHNEAFTKPNLTLINMKKSIFIIIAFAGSMAMAQNPTQLKLGHQFSAEILLSGAYSEWENNYFM